MDYWLTKVKNRFGRREKRMRSTSIWLEKSRGEIFVLWERFSILIDAVKT